jgi:hypothetical protein
LIKICTFIIATIIIIIILAAAAAAAERVGLTANSMPLKTFRMELHCSTLMALK